MELTLELLMRDNKYIYIYIYQHLQRGQQWKPLHYLGISIGDPFEGPGI